MTIYMIACSRRGYRLMRELEKKWKNGHPGSTVVCMVKCSAMPEASEKRDLSSCVEEGFAEGDAVVFISAAGIAVRMIAPFLKHKSVDPAVVVVDETGKFCISLLSGHMGGANELTERIAGLLGATPVITTATDRERKFAVDEFARKNHLKVTDYNLAKKVSAAVLEGERIEIFSDIPLFGETPKELIYCKEERALRDEAPEENRERPGFVKIKISCYRQLPEKDNVLLLAPGAVAVGIGCKKGASGEKIKAAVAACLEEEGILTEAVFAIASIDLKSREQGLVDYCREQGLPFLTYTAEELRAVEGCFEESSFVEQVTGVSNVCERSAVAAAAAESDKKVSEGGVLLCHRKIYDGVTVALAMRKGSAEF